MLRKIILNSFIADIKYIVRDPMLMIASLAPFFLFIFLILGFPLLSDYILLKTGFKLYDYYIIVAISLISLIPMLFGMVYAFILLDENDMHILQVIAVTPAGKNNFLYMRMIVPTVLSFIMVLAGIVITTPVPTEGWLRTTYVTFLLSSQYPFFFLFIGGLSRNKVEGLALSKLTGIFLAAIPLGLILHHPWNYFAFFSPFYWISWAWIASDPVESLIYGAISIVITAGCILIFFRHFIKKQSN